MFTTTSSDVGMPIVLAEATPTFVSGQVRRDGAGSRTAICLWLPTFELRLELARSPELDSTSVALLAPGEGATRELWQVSERASLSGVMPGQRVSEAVGLCPSLTLLEADPTHYKTTQDALVESLSRVTPILEPAGGGRVFLGMDGLGRLYGSPRNQIRLIYETLLEVFPRALVAAVRVGMAPGTFGAWVAAVASRPGKPRIIAEKELSAFLAPCSVGSLPVEPLMIQRLQRLGVSTLGDLVRFNEASLVRQFGLQGRDALMWARGERIDFVYPTFRPRPIRTTLDFPVPIGQSGTLHGALLRLLEQGLARPARKGRGVVGIRMGASLEGGGSWEIDIVLREPSSSAPAIAFPLQNRMAISPPPKAVETLFVEFYKFGPATTQTQLFDRKDASGRGAEGRALTGGLVPHALREAIRELKLKIGYSPLFRVVEMDPWSRLPERRHALLNFDP